MKAQICPVCNGKGKLNIYDKYTYDKTCHGCNGKGWIEVNDTPLELFKKPWIHTPKTKIQ